MSDINWSEIPNKESWSVESDKVTILDSEDDFRLKLQNASHFRWPKWESTSVTIWTTETISSWLPASVTNSWTEEDIILNFHIPEWVPASNNYEDLDNKPSLNWTTLNWNIILTKTDFWLSNVDNTSDANKPISMATQNALDDKADLDINWKILSSQMPSLAISEFLWNFPDLATAITQTVVQEWQRWDWLTTNEDISYILIEDNPTTVDWIKALKTPTWWVLSVNWQTGVVNITKNDIWLWNVDDTSDLDKPISTATQTAIIWLETELDNLATSIWVQTFTLEKDLSAWELVGILSNWNISNLNTYWNTYNFVKNISASGQIFPFTIDNNTILIYYSSTASYQTINIIWRKVTFWNIISLWITITSSRIWKIANNSFLITTSTSTSTGIISYVASLSWWILTLWTWYTLSGSASWFTTYDVCFIENNKFMLIYLNTSSWFKWYWVIINVSWSAISYWTPYLYMDWALSFTPNWKIILADTNKVLLILRSTETGYWTKIATISWNVITFWTNSMNIAWTITEESSLTLLEANKVLVHLANGAFIITVTGTTYSYWNTYTIWWWNYHNSIILPNWTLYCSYNEGNLLKSTILTISWTVITIWTIETVSNIYCINNKILYLWNNNILNLSYWSWFSSVNWIIALIWSKADYYIWILQEDWTIGSQKIVSILWQISKIHSGLTPWTKYNYWTAISSTKVLITENSTVKV